MRWFHLLITVLLSISFVSSSGIGNVDITSDLNGQESCLSNLHKSIRTLAKVHFDFSINYLYTGIAVSHQLVERPGLAKHLRDLSDSHWESGLSIVKKYISRGGLASDFAHKNVNGDYGTVVPFEVHGSNQFTEDKTYIDILTALQKDSESISEILNEIHADATRKCQDGDWGHFAEEKLEEEVKRTREMEGHVATLNQIKDSLLATEFFDSHL